MPCRRKMKVDTLALAVLGLLQEQPMHPYELASTLRERHKDSSFKVNSGSLYDTVEALARDGWIEPVETVRDGRRRSEPCTRPPRSARRVRALDR